jgi:hypothetical protein
MWRIHLLLIFLIFTLTGCNKGLAPDTSAKEGTLIVNLVYASEWPAQDQIFEFRFVAFKFKPATTFDFLRINEMLISDPLLYGAEQQQIIFEEVPNQRFYAGAVAWQFGPSILTDWRAAAVYADGNGEFEIDGNTVEITLIVDFNNLPDFP